MKPNHYSARLEPPRRPVGHLLRSFRVWTGLSAMVLGLLLKPSPAQAQADVVQGDSPDFLLDTRGVPPDPAAPVHADSANFTLDTTGLSPVVGGTAYADSLDFILNTTGLSPTIGGTAYADSLDFILDTTGLSPTIGGTAYADSLDFILNTTGLSPIVGGAVFADSLDFALDTRTNLVDIGLRLFDGTNIIKIAAQPPGLLTSPARLNKFGLTYGIALAATNSSAASRLRVQTSSGVKSWQKLP